MPPCWVCGQAARTTAPASKGLSRHRQLRYLAHNEADRIGERVDELNSLMTSSGVTGEIIVVSDGSTDETAARAGAIFGNVYVLDTPQRLRQGGCPHRGLSRRRE